MEINVSLVPRQLLNPSPILENRFQVLTWVVLAWKLGATEPSLRWGCSVVVARPRLYRKGAARALAAKGARAAWESARGADRKRDAILFLDNR